MRRKLLAIMLTISVLFIGIGLGGCSSPTKETETAEVSAANGDLSVWEEVSVNNKEYYSVQGSKEEFDLKEIITSADYVFRGTVVDFKEYEVRWTDEKGRNWGPFSNAVLEVRVDTEYYGNSPGKGYTVKVYYPYSLSMVMDGSVLIKEGGEYIFITQAFDKEFQANKSPEDRFEQYKRADVYISDAYYRVLPVEDEIVLMYGDYFIADKKIMSQADSADLVKTDKLVYEESGTSTFVALEENVFEKAFVDLFKNVEKLPDAKKIQEIHKAQNNHN